MTTPASPALFHLAGLPGLSGEPHIRPGNHLAVSHHPLLGLPAAPFVLQRLNPKYAGITNLRRDVIFRNEAGQILTLPIEVKPREEIRATLVQGSDVTCLWVGMLAEPARSRVRVPLTPIRTVDSRLAPTPVLTPIKLPQLTVPVVDLGRREKEQPPTKTAPAEAASVMDQFRAQLAAGAKQGVKGLRMRAYAPTSGWESALVGERGEAPYAIAAPGIAEVRITGEGTITDFAWIAAQDIWDQYWQSIDVLNLPHAGGTRYVALSDARMWADKRMRRQAPRRTPLQEAASILPPSAAASFAVGDEAARVHALADPLGADLDVLVNGATPPLKAAEQLPLTDAAGNALARDPGDVSAIVINRLARVLQGTLDPGVAAWLGYKGLDERYEDDGNLNIYRVAGLFCEPQDIGAMADDLLYLPLDGVPAQYRRLGRDAAYRHFSSLAAPALAVAGLRTANSLGSGQRYLLLFAYAAIDRQAPPAPPPPPTLLTPSHESWLFDASPSRRRVVRCPVAGMLAGGTLAVQREQPSGRLATLNRPLPNSRWHRLLLPGVVAGEDGERLTELTPHEGVITDREAGPDAARYHMAQQDRFGRWSIYATSDAAAGPRPRPPRPVVQGHYAQPSAADAASTGGVITLMTALPEPEALAPGAMPLSHLRFSFRHHEAGADPDHAVNLPDAIAHASSAVAIDAPPPGTAPRRAVPLEITGPVLQRLEARRMIVTAVWVDIEGRESEQSEPLRLLMVDPRAPEQMPIPDVLLYSSRPDATGLAWVERRWSVPTTAPTYAAYYSDEIRLLAWLRDSGRGAEAEEIATIADRAQRAGRLRDIQNDFPDHLFERLQGAVVAESPTTRRLRHAVSGASRVLNAYKIAAEAPRSGARPQLSGLDTVFYGVPNSDPPPSPRVHVRMVEPKGDEPALVAEVSVTFEAGVTPVRRVRIFRTRGGAADPLYAPVVTVLDVDADEDAGDGGARTITYRDTGIAQIRPAATLAPYARYQWFADVQGPPESGSDVEGLWSRTSAPVTAETVPATVPEPPPVTVSGTSTDAGITGLSVHVGTDPDLSATVLGNWAYELLRQEPGGQAWELVADGIVTQTPLVIADPVPDHPTPAGTTLRLLLRDPIGRPLPARESVVGG